MLEKPAISAWLFGYAYTCAISYGADAEALANSLDFPVEELEDMDNQFSPDAYIQMFDAAVRLTGDEFLWLRPVDVPNVSRNNASWYYSFNAKTLEEAAIRGEKYFNLLATAIRLESIFKEDSFLFRIRTVSPKIRFSDFQNDWNLGIWESIWAQYAGPPLKLKMVRTPVTDPVRLRRYEEYFQIPVTGGAEFNDLVYDKSAAKLPNIAGGADPNLDILFTKLLDEATASQKLASPFEKKLMTLFREELPNGTPTLKQIASKMGIGTRTLQRRLEEMDYTFSQAMQNYRQQLATAYLKEPELNVTDVALMVGYSSLSAFGAAFKSFHGISPTEYRMKHLG